ncbi:MAG: DinB family protein [Actinobacteria bacterium]|nr:DinB family protein [Actinomycetota bacterium]
MPITPDDKNWTWVLEQTCPDCGFDGRRVARDDVASLLHENVDEWPALLGRADVALRPTDDQWSALEYGCHVRDVFRLYEQRLDLMLHDDAPRFANWDQDVTAIEDRYDLQDPATVIDDLVAAGHSLADRFASVSGDQWERTGHRSDGVTFTVDTFARYLLHDPVHHVDDVRRGNEILDAGSLD